MLSLRYHLIGEKLLCDFLFAVAKIIGEKTVLMMMMIMCFLRKVMSR